MTTKAPPELSVIVPTFNERGNIGNVVRAIGEALENVEWEVIFVDDDSSDATAELARELARSDGRVRCLHRIGRRGLSTAVVEGMLSSSAPYLAVMDGDLQHDEKLLPHMLKILKEKTIDIAIGSRYVQGGGVGSWDTKRERISRFATRLSRLAIKAELCDPMSGFFMVKRDVFERAVRNLSGLGFKILIDIFASSPKPLQFEELPYQFRTRSAGESKLDAQAAWDYGMLILDKTIGKYVPVRFISFALIGGCGIGVHLLVFSMLYKLMILDFPTAQAAATLIAMVSNFALNNEITYRDIKLKGMGWVKGLVSFIAACSVGAFANVGIASYLFSQDIGWLPAALAGILVGAVWNYAVTLIYTWKSRS